MCSVFKYLSPGVMIVVISPEIKGKSRNGVNEIQVRPQARGQNCFTIPSFNYGNNETVSINNKKCAELFLKKYNVYKNCVTVISESISI